VDVPGRRKSGLCSRDGTEDVYKIYAESLRNDAHLEQILVEARAVVGRTLETAHVGA
jgi:phosphoglucomutase